VITVPEHQADARAAQTVQDIVVASLYHATAGAHSILAKDGQPDHRVGVPLT
jgi:hypothetical protein